jgi:hypothetical protein
VNTAAESAIRTAHPLFHQLRLAIRCMAFLNGDGDVGNLRPGKGRRRTRFSVRFADRGAGRRVCKRRLAIPTPVPAARFIIYSPIWSPGRGSLVGGGRLARVLPSGKNGGKPAPRYGRRSNYPS